MAFRSEGEKFAMLLITGITNFAFIPTLYLAHVNKHYFPMCIGLFTCFTSFMYHALDSIKWGSFYITSQNWHKLDNIGSIMCFISLIIYWMDNLQVKGKNIYVSRHLCDIDIMLNFGGLFLTMLMQANHPWEIKNTIGPILIFGSICIIKNLFFRSSRFNRKYVIKGSVILTFSVICFIKALDEDNDYLRIYHGLWHCGVSISGFYLWQIVDKDREIKEFHVARYCKQKRLEFGQAFMALFKPNIKKDDP
ncbi:unnamed protein product [Blepharisma stoltei]|uniref:Post-GPI attachment to proteins factor 3 n=1 Tax=Blepharisma stoltei TaxID=1481888 RepID=A0AAU9IZP9_9CILI|nr:unnamed protein product [Blepharisma stoltei]